jgi:hypothetical protein
MDSPMRRRNDERPMTLTRGGAMGLFRRKQSDEPVEARCPHCNEPVPEGADRCMMCGEDLGPLRGATRATEDEPPATAPPSP